MAEFYRNSRAYSGVCRPCGKAYSHKQADAGYFRDRRAKLALLRGPSRRMKPLTDIERTAAVLYDNVRKRAYRNGWDFTVTREWIEDQVRVFAASNYCEFTPRSPFKPSLDRLNSKGTYEISNLRVCWMIENYARNTFTDLQVIEFCKRKLGLL